MNFLPMTTRPGQYPAQSYGQQQPMRPAMYQQPQQRQFLVNALMNRGNGLTR